MMYSNKCLLIPGKALVNEAKESAEHCNLQMAINLEAGKSSLINVLSQFPATALWLLHRYEADASKPEQAVEVLTVTLAKIKSHYLLASLLFSGRGFKHKADADEKQQLTEALAVFPFSIED